MQKSNWIIVAVLVIASLLFLGLWHGLQFSSVDAPLDIVIALVWWLLIVAICVAIHLAEKRREERIRTIFLAPGLIYNSEMGVLRLGENTSVIEALAKVLADLTYNFEVAELPPNSRVRFQRIVRSSKFSEAGKIWEGEVLEVSHPDHPTPFHNRSELANIINNAS